MAKPEEKQIYSYQEFHDDCVKIAEWAKDKKFKGVFGIRRGGLMPAVVLSHLLDDLPLIVSEADITKSTLIVDDILDKGGTIQRLLSRIGEGYKIAVLFWSKESFITPDFYARERKMWVKFPWETEKSSRYNGTV